MPLSTACEKQIKFQRERFFTFWRDVEGPILTQHWEELALDKDKIGLSFDTARYENLEREGNLFIITMREGDELAGYFVLFLMKHLHYDQAGMMAYTDVYFVRPEFRKAGAGVKLFRFAEAELKKLGVVKIYLSCKAHFDHTNLFEAMGYKLSDYAFTKMLA